MTILKRLMGRLSPPAEDQNQAAAPEQVAAAVDLQKTMGRDRVTGLPHRACFAHVLTLQGQIAARLETRLSVVVLEWPGYAEALDPGARDRQLNRLAAALRDRLHRTHDVLGSLGDGRLAAMLPFTDGAGADTVARNLQQAAHAALAEAPAPAAVQPAGLDDAAPSGDERGAVAPGAAAADDDHDNFESPGDDHDHDHDPDHGRAVVNVGISSYNGKGGLADDGLLKAAERAVAFAAMNGGDRVVRFDPGADAAR